MNENRMTDPAAVTAFVTGGNATFTLVSTGTSVRYTFRAKAPKRDENEPDDGTRFVSLLTGPDNTADYVYLGMLGRDGKFRATKATGPRAGTKPFFAFEWFWGVLRTRDVLPASAEFWHEGRCCRCNRVLTVPSSVALGIGPECAAKNA